MHYLCIVEVEILEAEFKAAKTIDAAASIAMRCYLYGSRSTVIGAREEYQVAARKMAKKLFTEFYGFDNTKSTDGKPKASELAEFYKQFDDDRSASRAIKAVSSLKNSIDELMFLLNVKKIK